jgi:hypothetical protein
MDKIQSRYDQVATKVDAYAEYLLGAQEGLMEKLQAAKSRMVDRIIELGEKQADEEMAELEAQAAGV